MLPTNTDILAGETCYRLLHNQLSWMLTDVTFFQYMRHVIVENRLSSETGGPYALYSCERIG